MNDNYPEKIKIEDEIDLKLGIKSSMPKLKSPIALLYFLWISNNCPGSLDYCEETEEKRICLKNDVFNKLWSFLLEKKLVVKEDKIKIKKLISENNLFTSQIESLKVAFELVWKIAEFTFKDSNIAFSAERQKQRGVKIRYPKIINYSRDIDLINLLVCQNEEKYLKVLYSWLSVADVGVGEKNDLEKLFTMLSDEAIYKIRLENENIHFNMSGVYKKLVSNNSIVTVKGDKETSGSLRILSKILQEDFNYFLKIESSNKVILEDRNPEQLELVKNYANRISTHFKLSNIDLSTLKEDVEKVSEIADCLDIGCNSSKLKEIKHPHQRIFFGAPGTGKSYELNKQAGEFFGFNYERVTFHPNFMYSNFVGSFKPYPKLLTNKKGDPIEDKNGNISETITYEYVPGVLLRQLIKALKNPCKNYLLLVEEINRTNVAAVFGDLFQLLDRNLDGDSEYCVTTSKELQEYVRNNLCGVELSNQVKEKLGEDYSKLFLPSNFYIWSTMNSSDQGVMPMDTAFKRRWDFVYMGIDDVANKNMKDFARYNFKVNSKEKANWDEFRRAINLQLSLLGISEDKLIGPYFISKSLLEELDIDKLSEIIKEKVLMYLYEDAARLIRSQLFADNKYSTYSKLCESFTKNALSLFRENIDIKTELI